MSMSLNQWELNRYRQQTDRSAGAYRVSPTRLCQGCRKLRSVRQFEGGVYCRKCRGL